MLKIVTGNPKLNEKMLLEITKCDADSVTALTDDFSLGEFPFDYFKD